MESPNSLNHIKNVLTWHTCPLIPLCSYEVTLPLTHLLQNLPGHGRSSGLQCSPFYAPGPAKIEPGQREWHWALGLAAPVTPLHLKQEEI